MQETGKYWEEIAASNQELGREWCSNQQAEEEILLWRVCQERGFVIVQKYMH